MKTKLVVLLILLSSVLLFTGCGESEQLSDFQENMENFCTDLLTLSDAINQIDPDSDTAGADLLFYIDETNELFASLRDMDFPEPFESLQDFADEAADYMATATDAYHAAYETEIFDKNQNDYAYANYKRAYKRLQIILIYIRGDEPDEEFLLTD